MLPEDWVIYVSASVTSDNWKFVVCDNIYNFCSENYSLSSSRTFWHFYNFGPCTCDNALFEIVQFVVKQDSAAKCLLYVFIYLWL